MISKFGKAKRGKAWSCRLVSFPHFKGKFWHIAEFVRLLPRRRLWGLYNPLSFTFERKAIKLLCIEVELLSVSDKPNIKL